MFKENDNMRPGPTPERVLAICRLLENNSYNQGELYKLSQLSDDPTSEEAVNHSIQVAKELDLIRCNLRRAAATGAFASGRSAEHNGHPY